MESPPSSDAVARVLGAGFALPGALAWRVAHCCVSSRQAASQPAHVSPLGRRRSRACTARRDAALSCLPDEQCCRPSHFSGHRGGETGVADYAGARCSAGPPPPAPSGSRASKAGVVRGLALLALLARLLVGPAPSLASGPAVLDGRGGQQGRELRTDHSAGPSGFLHHVRRGGAGEVVAISAGLPASAGATGSATAATAATAATVSAGCGQAAVLWAKWQRNWMLYCTIPVVAGLLNWATNNLAVKMIFYPLNFWGLRLKTWPDTPLGLIGLVPPSSSLGPRISERERQTSRADNLPDCEAGCECACASAAGRVATRCAALRTAASRTAAQVRRCVE